MPSVDNLTLTLENLGFQPNVIEAVVDFDIDLADLPAGPARIYVELRGYDPAGGIEPEPRTGKVTLHKFQFGRFDYIEVETFRNAGHVQVTANVSIDELDEDPGPGIGTREVVIQPGARPDDGAMRPTPGGGDTIQVPQFPPPSNDEVRAWVHVVPSVPITEMYSDPVSVPGLPGNKNPGPNIGVG